MEPRDSSRKMLTLDDLPRLVFEADPELMDIVWNGNIEEMGKSFITIL
jgi:hypothetical protein